MTDDVAGTPAIGGELPTFASVETIDAGVLAVGYAEAGPADGPAVVLLHGWPYDIHSYLDVVPVLAAQGYRVIVPYLRGHGPTRFLSDTTLRTGQQSVLAVDVIALMDALEIEEAILGRLRLGRADGGHRGGAVAGTLQRAGVRERISHRQPGRPAGVRYRPRPNSNGGTSTTSRRNAAAPATTRYRHDFAKLIWQTASPKWNFDDATFARSAVALDNPDHVDIVIHNYRWRLGLADGDPQYDDVEARLAAGAGHHRPHDHA